MKIFDKIISNYKSDKPFVVYRKPNEETISSWFLEDDTLFFTHTFSETGFIFAPFNSDEKAILFPLDKSVFKSEKLLINEVIIRNDSFSNEDSKENHINLVEETIAEINKKNLKKVVVSRKEEVLITDTNVVDIYQKLLQNYKNAFVYVWFHPKIGLWFGATPETLLNINNSSFKTMSLAGTQVFKNTKKIVWDSKELEEQQLVTDFIERKLQPISTNLKIKQKETVKAGSLLHLRTKVVGDLNKDATLKSLIRALHPTPAVCGLPREEAKKFILEKENYNRSFYTGFLGELNLRSKDSENKKSSLFVNLRCMNVAKDVASIFVGGGITKDSNAKKEWEETVSKSKIMKNVLKKKHEQLSSCFFVN